MHLYLSFKSTTWLFYSLTMSISKHVSISCCMSGSWDRSGWKWHSGFEHEKESKPRQSYASHFFQHSTSHSFLFSFQSKQHPGKCSLLPGTLWTGRLGYTNQLQQDPRQERRRKRGIFSASEWLLPLHERPHDSLWDHLVQFKGNQFPQVEACEEWAGFNGLLDVI